MKAENDSSDCYHRCADDDRSTVSASSTSTSGTSIIRLYRAGGSHAKEKRRSRSLRSVTEDLPSTDTNPSSVGCGSSLSMLLNPIETTIKNSERNLQQQKNQPQQKEDGSIDIYNSESGSNRNKINRRPSSSATDGESNSHTKGPLHRLLPPVSETDATLQHSNHSNSERNRIVPDLGSNTTPTTASATTTTTSSENNDDNNYWDVDNQSQGSVPSLTSFNSESVRSRKSQLSNNVDDNQSICSRSSMPSLASYNSESMRSRKSIISTASSNNSTPNSEDSFASLDVAPVITTDIRAALPPPPPPTAIAALPSTSKDSGDDKSNNHNKTKSSKNSILSPLTRKGSRTPSVRSFSADSAATAASRIMARFVGGLRARNVSVPVPPNDVVAGTTLECIEFAAMKKPYEEQEMIQQKRRQRWGGGPPQRSKSDCLPQVAVRKGSLLHHGYDYRNNSGRYGTDGDGDNELIVSPKQQRERQYRNNDGRNVNKNHHPPKKPTRDFLPHAARRRSSSLGNDDNVLAAPPPKKDGGVTAAVAGIKTPKSASKRDLIWK